MPLPPSLPHPIATSTSSVTSAASASASPTQNPSLVHRLLDSVPEHAIHLFEKLLAPNTTQYTPSQNDPHKSAPASPILSSPAPLSPESGPRVWYRRRSMASKGKEVMARRVEVVEVNGCQIVDEETERVSEEVEGEVGVPLCREAEIEKWKLPHEGEGEIARRKIRRRYTFH